jgi:hypothetical protein
MSQTPVWFNTFCYSQNQNLLWYPFLKIETEVTASKLKLKQNSISGIRFDFADPKKADFLCVLNPIGQDYKDYSPVAKRTVDSQFMKKDAFVVPPAGEVTTELLMDLVDLYGWPEQFLYNKPIPVRLTSLHSFQGFKVYEAYHHKNIRMCYPASWISFNP